MPVVAVRQICLKNALFLLYCNLLRDDLKFYKFCASVDARVRVLTKTRLCARVRT